MTSWKDWTMGWLSSAGSSSSPAEFHHYSEHELEDAMNQTGTGTPERGSYGNVHKGKSLSGKTVAIKKIDIMPPIERDQFIDKLKELFPSKLQHDNIVEYLGYCSSRTGNCPLYLVSMMEQHNLTEIIDGGRPIEWPAHFKIIKGIADGVRHMHRQKTVHLDLKPSNILLDSQMIPKINDFRTARVLTNLEDMNSFKINYQPGTEGPYSSPELANAPTDGGNKVTASAKSDVFSFGAILFQIIRHVCVDSGMSLVDWREMVMTTETEADLRALVRSRNPAIRDKVTMCLKIGMQCCAVDQADRLPMKKVVKKLEEAQKKRR